ncbi:MAG: glycosyltransferase family protein [Rhodospirillales bacterium]
MTRRVMFYVQHLLGIGHLKRASILAQAMSEAGLDVAVVLGGPPVEGIDFFGCARILLPPATAADPGFSEIVDDAGRPIDDAWRDHRLARLLTEFEAFRPHVLVVEQFPFGRRQFGFELMPLLQAARGAQERPWIISSVRDAVVRKSSERGREMAKLAGAWFDCILVHGDATVLRLDETLPEIAAVADKLVYTGYVADRRELLLRPFDHTSGRDEVIVSVGGGAVGEPLLRSALAARPLTPLSGHVWRLICGPNLPAGIEAELRWGEGPGIVVDRWRSDLPVLLRNCVLSISQAGYNTVVQLLQAGTRAVVVPFALQNETEQEQRARTFAERGLMSIVASDAASGEISPSALAGAVDAALLAPPPNHSVDLEGAATAARFLLSLGAQRAGHRGMPDA